MYLEELAAWHKLANFDFVYWNMLHEAYYHSVGTLPDRAKQIAIERLKNANVTEYHRREFDNIIDFINGGVSLDGNMLRIRTRGVDVRRNQDLRTHHPELAQAIDYEGPF